MDRTGVALTMKDAKNEGRPVEAALLRDSFSEVSVTACHGLASRGNPPPCQMASLPFNSATTPRSWRTNRVVRRPTQTRRLFSQKALCDTSVYSVYSIDGIVAEVKIASRYEIRVK